MARSSSSLLDSLEAEAGGGEADTEGPGPSLMKAPATTAAHPGDSVPGGDGVPRSDGVLPGSKVRPGDGVPRGSKKRHVRSFEPSVEGTPKKGRPVNHMQKTCLLCGAGDQDEDPTQVDYENTKAAGKGDGRDGTGKLAIRWLYPRVEGMAQGNFCYYCGKTVELGYPDTPAKNVKEKVVASGADRATFFQRRNILVEHVAKNGSFKDLKDVVVSVSSEQSTGQSYTHRGRLVSVRKYKQKTGRAPTASQVISATSRSGKRKDVVKVYDHEDSSSWSFSDKEDTKVTLKRELDSGNVVLKEGQAEDQFEAAVAAQGVVNSKGGHATFSEMAALEAQKAGAVPVKTPADQSGGKTSAQSAREEALSAQEARDRAAEEWETMSRATGLLQGRVSKTKTNYAKAKALPKGKKVAGPAETHKKAVRAFIEATKALQDTIAGESSLQGLLRHEDALKTAVGEAKGKADLAVQLDMQEELEPSRELSDFAVNAREAQRAWKAYGHSQTDKNRAKFVEAWRAFKPWLPPDCGLCMAAAQDLMKGVVMDAVQAAIQGTGNWEAAGRACSEEGLRTEYNLTDLSQLKTVQKAQVVTIFKQVVRALHKDRQALYDAWGQILEGTGAVLDRDFEDLVAAFHVVFSVDVATVSNDAATVSGVEKAVEHLGGAADDSFVKHVSAVASRILRPVFEQVRGRTGAAKKEAKGTTFSEKCHQAKVAACKSTESDWAKISQEMAGWRRLSAEAAAATGEATETAFSDLQAAWDSLWLRFFQPTLEQLAKQGSTPSGCCDSVQHMQEFVVQTQSWLDARGLSRVAPAPGPDPVVTWVRTAHAFASAGVALAKCGCGIVEPTPEQTALLGDLGMAMRVLKKMPLGEVACPSLATAVEAWGKEAQRLGEKGVQELVEELLEKWLLPPDHEQFLPEGGTQAVVDLTGETAAVSEACELAGLSGHVLWVQLGGHMHQARAQALKAKKSVVDGGDGTEKLAQAIDEALEAENPEEAIARVMPGLKGAEVPLRCDKDLGKCLQNVEEELDRAAAIVKQSEKRLSFGLDDDLTKQAGGSASLRGVERGRRELQELRATVSSKFTAGLQAFVELASSKLLPDFENVCAGPCPEKEDMAKLGTEPTVPLVPALAPKLKAYMEAAALCGADTGVAEAVHKRMRVYLGVAHVADLLYGKSSEAQQPTPEVCAATVRKLKSLGIWGDMPRAMQGALAKT